MIIAAILFVFTILSSIAAGAGDPLASVREAFETKDWDTARTVLEGVAPSARGPEHAVLSARLDLIEGRADEASEALERAAKRWPEDPEVRYWLGNAYHRRSSDAGMLAKLSLARKMKASWTEAVELQPDHLGARESLVRFGVEAPGIAGGSFAEARTQAREMQRFDRRRGLRLAAWVEMQDDEPDRAVAIFEEAVREDPDDPGLRVQFALTLQQLERWRDVFAQLDAALARDPAYPGALYQLGRTGVMSGLRREDGIRSLQRYLELPDPGKNQPSKAWAQYRLGMLFEKAGRREEAMQAYRAAVELDPEHPEAGKALRNIES